MSAKHIHRVLVSACLVVLAVGAVSEGALPNVALGKPVTLNGGAFFVGGWADGVPAGAGTIVDGVFFPRGHQWNKGPVWWDSTDDAARWIEIDLGAIFQIESLIVQADDNDAYELYYWDIINGAWQLAWDVPNYDAQGWGMQTRPDPTDDGQPYVLPAPIVTNRLRFQGNMTSGDKLFAVSEIQAFGKRIAIDIKPQSCPNPVNTKSRGVLPVAILGTEDFDVTTIDPATVRLAGVAPLRWSLEDVATPIAEGADGCACTTEGPDGYRDLTLKFNTQEIVAALGAVADGEVRMLTLTADLTDGTPIIGTDCVVIRSKGKPK